MHHSGGDVSNEGGCACGGQKVDGKISVLSAQFCCESKTALKKLKS